MKDSSGEVSVFFKKIGKLPELVMVLGTGWKRVVEEMEVETEVSYKEWLGVEASVPGHEGKLIIGKLNGKRVAVMNGRLHMYEGYSAREATMPIRALAEAGAKRMIVTSAVGALNEKYEVGDFVILSDMMTLFLSPDNPLVGPEFVDLSEAFDLAMREQAVKVCVKENIRFHEGVYVYIHGPNFETPADKMALRQLGADVVGMSTVPETIAAKALGIEVLGLSFVTNLAFVKHSHKEVLAAAEEKSGKMVELLTGIVGEIG